MGNSTVESSIVKIKKRNGSIVDFNVSKISGAIFKALSAKSKPDRALADSLASDVVKKLDMENPAYHPPSVEYIQDMVESTLIESGHSEIAKAYILYRAERRRVRDAKLKLLNAAALDDVSKKFELSCLQVLASRYLMRNDKNEIREAPSALFDRVATLVALGDLLYDPDLFAADASHGQDLEEARAYLSKLDGFDCKFSIGKHVLNKYHFRALINHYVDLAARGQMKVGFKALLTSLASKKFEKYAERIDEYYSLMTSQVFLPNSPTMMNAGGRLGQLSACFVLGMPDDMEGIMKSTSDAALIFKSGGGVGINYSDLRHEGDIVASTSGVASGPVSFMNIINTVTEVVKQGGKRRGANMGIIEAWHPDVERFITNKTTPGVLENFNVSVGVWEDFWGALVGPAEGKYLLRDARTRAPVGEANAHQILDLIALSAWKSAEPGLIFFDQINKYNVMAKARGGPLRSTNPCGEQSLYPYESCNLGSINLAKLVTRTADGGYAFDWQKYEETIRKTTRYLDNIIDVNLYPIPEISRASKESRRIGLGVMGVADLLYKLRIPYNSKESYDLQSKLAEALTYFSMEESVELARSRGEFPLCPQTEYPEGKIPVAGYYERPRESHTYDWDALIEKIKRHGIRNVLTTTVAPTGTLSMLAACSSGMEPNFALSYEKRVTVGKFFYTNRVVEETLREAGLYSDELAAKIADNYGSVRGIEEVPEWMQKIFVTAMDIHWSDHLLAQGVWQAWIGNAIAKTINMPHDASVTDVKAAYLLAHELGLKGITVYRDGSRHTQVLNMASENAKKRFEVEPSEHVLSCADEILDDAYVKEQVAAALSVKPPSPPLQAEEPIAAERIAADAKAEGRNRCPHCRSDLVFAEGCSMCIDCGYSGCSSA